MAAKLSALEGFITDKEVQQIEYLLQKVNLPITISSKIDYQDFSARLPASNSSCVTISALSEQD
jgi:3-dehydroquinate synthetase